MSCLKWLFIDFDSYFASVEQHLNPQLIGKPVGVLPTLAETTSCIAASYEAKRFGVRTGTRVCEARRLCPNIQFVVADHKVYVEYHQLFKQAIEGVIPIHKTLSIDEVACKLPSSLSQAAYVENFIHHLQSHLARSISPVITCSIGASANQFLAKLASKYNKPNGYYIVTDELRAEFLREHALGDLNGIGRNMEVRLNRAGVYTVSQLLQCSEERLRQVWNGVNGSKMWHALRGGNLSEVQTQTSSIGHSHVLAPNKRVPHHARTVLHRLLQKAVLRLRAKSYVTANVRISLRYENGERWAMEAKFDETAQNHLLSYAVSLLWEQRSKPQLLVKSISVNFTQIKAMQNYTLSLFSKPDPKREALDKALDSIVSKFGKNSAYYGSAHGAISSAPMRIAFTHIPNTILEE